MPSKIPATETDKERAERWRAFWASPAEIHENLSLDEIDAAGEAYWRWDGEPELDL